MVQLINPDRCGEFVNDLAEMHRLRYRIFKERLGWDVQVSADMEVDEFDACRPVYLLQRTGSQGASTAVKRCHAGGKPYEERQRIDGEREEQNRPIPNRLRMSPMTSMVEASVTKDVTVAPPTTTAAQYLVKPGVAANWNLTARLGVNCAHAGGVPNEAA